MTISRVITLLLLCCLVGCFSYNKECYDGVCKITENGKVTYTGDPEKIKQVLEMEARIFGGAEQNDQKYKSLPKRANDEVIRVGIIFPETEYASLKSYRQQYYNWMKEALADPRFQIVPHSQLRSYLNSAQSKVPVNKGWNEDGPREKWAFVPNESSYKKLRDMGIGVDVLIYTSMSPKSQSGLVGGRGQGVGIMKASRIEISGVASSVYEFTRFNASKVGRSSGQIDIAGVDRSGEVKSASIKGHSRTIELDKEAVYAYANQMKRFIKNSIAANLPSLTALASIK